MCKDKGWRPVRTLWWQSRQEMQVSCMRTVAVGWWGMAGFWIYFKIVPRSNYSFRFLLSRILPDVDQRKVPFLRDPMISYLSCQLFSHLLFGGGGSSVRMNPTSQRFLVTCFVSEVKPGPRSQSSKATVLSTFHIFPGFFCITRKSFELKGHM